MAAVGRTRPPDHGISTANNTSLLEQPPVAARSPLGCARLPPASNRGGLRRRGRFPVHRFPVQPPRASSCTSATGSARSSARWSAIGRPQCHQRSLRSPSSIYDRRGGQEVGFGMFVISKHEDHISTVSTPIKSRSMFSFFSMFGQE